MVRLEKANDGKHKWIAHFKNGRITRFGAVGMDDYTLTHNMEQRERYRKRHAKDLSTNDPYRAGYLSWFLLWGSSTSLGTNLAAYNARFGV
jgi:hypothetical protein